MSGFRDGDEVSAIIFVYVGDIKLCLDSSRVCFYIRFWITFIKRNMYEWYYCGWRDVSCVPLLFCGEVGIYDVGEVFVLFLCVVLDKEIRVVVTCVSFTVGE